MALLESERRREAARGLVGEPPPPESKAPAPDARPPAPELRPPAPRAEAPPKISVRRITIAIDPGHGGEDPGAIGRGGTYEKNAELPIARRLKTILTAKPNMRAMLTRAAAYSVP